MLDSKDKKFALKLLAPKKPKAAYARFKTEIAAIRKLNHPNIIKVVDSSDDPEFPYYVMEYVKGAVSLREALDSGKNPYSMDPVKAVDFFIQLSEVVKACEFVKVVHRDFSPGNVLLLPDGTIKVIDFGVCQIEGGETVTLTDESVGTHNYMAPECESGAEDKVDSRADLYSAGKLLWTAITGQKAFSRETPVFNSKSLRLMLPDCMNAWHLNHLFERTIRHDVSNRFKNAEDALVLGKHVKRVISNRFPPLEFLAELGCPSCGFGKVDGFPGNTLLFNLPEYMNKFVALRCNVCGYCFVLDIDTANKSLEKRKGLS